MFKNWYAPFLGTVFLFCMSCQSQVFLFTTLSLGSTTGSSLSGQPGGLSPSNEALSLQPSVSPPVSTPTPTPLPTPSPTPTPGGDGTGTPTETPVSAPAPLVTPIPQATAGFVFATGDAVSLSVSPSSLTLSKQGEQQSLIVRVKNAAGEFLDPATFQILWTSSNPAQISVDGNGVVTAVGNSGVATITATIANTNIADSASVQMGSSGSQPPPPDTSNQDALQGIIDFS